MPSSARVALITGCGKPIGIGNSTARALAAAGVTVIVNNAGAPQGADRNEIEDVPLEAWDKTMGVNARGAFLMSRAAVPTMRQARWSSVFLRRPPLGQAGTARLMPPPRRQSSASPNRWHSTWRPSALPSMPSAPVPFALRGRSAPTGANMATISR